MTGEPQGVKPATDQPAEVQPGTRSLESDAAPNSAESQDASTDQPVDDAGVASPEQPAAEQAAAATEQPATVQTAGAAAESAAAPALEPEPAAASDSPAEAAPSEIAEQPTEAQAVAPQSADADGGGVDAPPPTAAPAATPVPPAANAPASAPEPPPLAAAPAIPSFTPTLPNPRPSAPLIPPIQGDAPAPSAAPNPADAAAPDAAAGTAAPAAGDDASDAAHPLPGLPTAGAADAADEDDVVEFEPEAYEQMLDSYGPEVAELREGEKRDGAVVSVSEDGAVVDFGGKTEGFLSAKDVAGRIDLTTLEPGAMVQVVVARIGEPGEYVKLELAREENNEAWAALEEAYRDHTPVEATALERVKGGLSVMVAGLQAFLPGSQAAAHGGGDDLDALIGTSFLVAVVKLSRKRGNIVVSARELVEQETRALKQETLSKLSVGSEAVGKVKNVTSYGAFVDLGGIDGLIHVTDISYGRIKDPSAVLAPGQEVTAKVIKLDAEKERVSLSLKAMEPDPWETVSERYQEGMVVKGAVASVTDYGAFVELEPGVEGLIHITEMTWSKRLRHPSKVLQDGQEIETVVLNVNPGERRISLSLRQRLSDPWESAGERYARGAIVEGRVRNVTSYGAFVELEEGVDGLVHVSDLTWDTRVRNPKEIVQKGQTIQAVVLEVDAENRRLSLGLKQLQPDAWEGFFAEHGLGEILPGRVSRHAKFGYFVELAPGVEGLCHNSQIPHHGKSRKAPLSAGRTYEFEIIKVDESDKRIGLRSLSLEPLEEGRSE